jgi:hypothetical protein
MSLVKVDVDAQIDVIVPTAINIVLMVNQNIIQNLRKAQASNLVLPSLYKRAYLIVNETDEIAVIRQVTTG